MAKRSKENGYFAALLKSIIGLLLPVPVGPYRPKPIIFSNAVNCRFSGTSVGFNHFNDRKHFNPGIQ